LTCIFETTTTS